MAQAIILQGSNQGDRYNFLKISENLISEKIGLILNKSPIYESEPWGFETSEWFLNRVLIVETKLAPTEILKQLLSIENQLGRVRNDKESYQSRSIDLDILFIDNQIIETLDLTIPHPRLQNRIFTLIPLCDILPNFIHPIFNKSISELLDICEDQSVVLSWQSCKKG